MILVEVAQSCLPGIGSRGSLSSHGTHIFALARSESQEYFSSLEVHRPDTRRMWPHPAPRIGSTATRAAPSYCSTQDQSCRFQGNVAPLSAGTRPTAPHEGHPTSITPS